MNVCWVFLPLVSSDRNLDSCQDVCVFDREIEGTDDNQDKKREYHMNHTSVDMCVSE